MKKEMAQTKGSSRSSNSFCLREAKVARGQALPPREDMVNADYASTTLGSIEHCG